MRHLDEAAQVLGQPVVAAGKPAGSIHPLLYDDPVTIVGDDETMQVEIKTILHRGAVDLGDEPAGIDQCGPVEADAFGDVGQFLRCPPRMAAATAADVDAEFAAQRGKPPLQRTDDAGGDAGGVPVHPHDRSERLEPERMG